MTEENKELKKKLELDEVQLESYFIGEEKICKENGKYRKALEEISSKLDRALDADETDAEESFDLLYEIQDKINEVLNESK